MKTRNCIDQELGCYFILSNIRDQIFENPVRELSKVLDGTTPAAMKEMFRVIKYVLDTRGKGLRIEPTFGDSGPWDLVCYSDSDYAGDPDSRQSVSGFILYVKGVPSTDQLVIKGTEKCNFEQQ